jgi:CheY-like chemotaxis protein
MSKKLLLADDSITIQKVIQITFAHEDYELTITDNGDAALAKAQEIVPDLIMSDIYMPGKNGYELTSAIKQDPALRHVPVLLLAGSFEPFDEDKARSCKADAWIEKPFESQSLIDKVSELLSAAQTASESPTPEPEPFAAESEPFAAEPEPFAAEPESFAAEPESPLAAFDAPFDIESEATVTQEDPFADISFEEEMPDTEPEPVSASEDWSDVIAEPVAAAPVVDDTFAISEDFSFTDEEPATEVFEDFSFTEEAPVAARAFSPAAEVPLAETVFDAFEMDEDEIMSLDDDDILGAEDLEPVMPEQTLAAWSRDEVAIEDVFAEPLEDEFASEPEPVLEDFIEPAPVEETSVLFDEEAVAEATPVSESPAVEPAPVERPTAVVEEPEPVAMAKTIEDVEAQASALREEDIEKIIEKIVSRVVEKLAGSILERVAWDVVPDLAESLIREEIRKIKDAAAA